ncbi:MAG: gamma-glutamyl-gamma-aminobutyrate hydrolase family protein [Armatimonadota bacterium]|nr:gamma-glutamyl-gamma-aminobutyrate hydrolase family protein [Armatimonadota bacterium]
MICYVVTETLDKYREMQPHQLKLDLERLSGDRCLVMHYSGVTRELLEQARPWALCHSGGSTSHDEYDVLDCDDYRWAITESGIPQIGFCGGHQLIGEMFGAEVDIMRELADDEADLAPDYHPGTFKEWGIWPVRLVADNPLFEGLPNPIRVREAHRSEIKQLPEGFRLLASSADCRIQAMVHETMCLYGVQFHPESRVEGYPDGHNLLGNFFRIARGRAG